MSSPSSNLENLNKSRPDEISKLIFTYSQLTAEIIYTRDLLYQKERTNAQAYRINLDNLRLEMENLSLKSAVEALKEELFVSDLIQMDKGK